MLRRTVTGAVILAIVLGAWASHSGRPGEPAWALAALGVLVFGGALDELLVMGGTGVRLRRVGWLAGAGWLALLVAAGLSSHELSVAAGDLLTAASAVAGGYLLAQLRHGPGKHVARLSSSLWFDVPYVGGILCLVALLLTGAVEYVVALVLVAKSSDVGAYFCGKSMGRRKLAPRVSPGKTVEGAVGGLVLPMIVAAWLLDGVVLVPSEVAERVLPGGMPGAALHGLVVGVLAILSDLSESLLKRSVGVKDSGTLFGESGGFLDLVDSLLLVGPVALAYTAVVA